MCSECRIKCIAGLYLELTASGNQVVIQNRKYQDRNTQKISKNYDITNKPLRVQIKFGKIKKNI